MKNKSRKAMEKSRNAILGNVRREGEKVTFEQKS